MARQPQARDSHARSGKTEAEYEKRVPQLYKRVWKQRALHLEDAVIRSPVDVTNDLITSPDAYSPRSWVLYRAALLWHLASNRHVARTMSRPTRSWRHPDTIHAGMREQRRVRLGLQRLQTRSKKTIPPGDLTRLTGQLIEMNGSKNWGL